MNKLKQEIIAKIQKNGPLGVDEYMRLCLSDPQSGYYTTKKHIFGQKGDFTTSPEISQIFGECLSIFMVLNWQRMGAPAAFISCELGPGRGTLVDDILRSLKKISPECFKAAQWHLIETSASLRQIQQQKLASHNVCASWHESLEELPPLPLLLIGNEVLDALPIQQWVKKGDKMYERKITTTAEGELAFTLSPCGAASFGHHTTLLPQGKILETAPERAALVQDISQHLHSFGGMALFIDYGTNQPAYGDTLQALSHHNYSDIFAAPGEDDLTSHVDFFTLAQALKEKGTLSYIQTQANFLFALGAQQRAQRLCQEQKSEIKQKIVADLERLTSPQQMGQLFKAFCFSATISEPLPFTQQDRLS